MDVIQPATLLDPAKPAKSETDYPLNFDDDPDLIPAGSHRTTTMPDGKIVVHDVELFLGYDPDFDSPDDPVAKYTPQKIRDIVARTTQYMERGQLPKLIGKHNDENDPEPRPAIGDIISIRVAPNDARLIIGDIEMQADDFETYLASNKYPRRSAEIWGSDGYLSEVALLGSQTPARPIADTKFAKGNPPRERFSRVMPSRSRRPSPPGVCADDSSSHRSDMTELDRARDDLDNATDPADIERFGRRFSDLHRRHISTTTHNDLGQPGRRKERSTMYGRSTDADRETFDALKAGGQLVAAAKFAKAHGIDDEQLDRAVPVRSGARDTFGRAVTESYGDQLIEAAEHYQRDAECSEAARDWCCEQGITDPLKFIQRRAELLRQYG